MKVTYIAKSGGNSIAYLSTSDELATYAVGEDKYSGAYVAVALTDDGWVEVDPA